jgi:UDP-N-acetylglucosamine 2-epimerase (non-hydrolysing)
MVDQLSDALFAPTELASRRLLLEGCAEETVFMTGNTVVDALLWGREIVRRHPPEIPWLAPWSAQSKMILVTAHRRESFGPALEGMCRAMIRILHDVPEARIVYPVHPNPNVEGPVGRILGHHPRIIRLKPVTYLEFIALMEHAHIVLTDSGGVQEEAPTFRKPLLVMREVTERPEGIEAGVARLVGTDEDRIYEETVALLTDPARYAAMASGANPYGDGKAARRIAEVLERGVGVKPPRVWNDHRVSDHPAPAGMSV